MNHKRKFKIFDNWKIADIEIDYLVNHLLERCNNKKTAGIFDWFKKGNKGNKGPQIIELESMKPKEAHKFLNNLEEDVKHARVFIVSHKDIKGDDMDEVKRIYDHFKNNRAKYIIRHKNLRGEVDEKLVIPRSDYNEYTRKYFVDHLQHSEGINSGVHVDIMRNVVDGKHKPIPGAIGSNPLERKKILDEARGNDWYVIHPEILTSDKLGRTKTEKFEEIKNQAKYYIETHDVDWHTDSEYKVSRYAIVHKDALKHMDFLSPKDKENIESKKGLLLDKLEDTIGTHPVKAFDFYIKRKESGVFSKMKNEPDKVKEITKSDIEKQRKNKDIQN